MLPKEAAASIYAECMQHNFPIHGVLHGRGLLYTMQLVDGALVSPRRANLDMARQKYSLHCMIIGSFDDHGVDDGQDGAQPFFDMCGEWENAVKELEQVSNLK